MLLSNLFAAQEMLNVKRQLYEEGGLQCMHASKYLKLSMSLEATQPQSVSFKSKENAGLARGAS